MEYRKSLEDLYLTVSKEYNKTDLAIKDGWVHTPNDYGLRELEIFAKYTKPNN